jgi:ubiquinone/menaquinone biosynthesis C-methylase UbiE
MNDIIFTENILAEESIALSNFEQYNNDTIKFVDHAKQFTSFQGKRILEIGCGSGDMVKCIANEYNPSFVVGIEPSLSEWWSTKPDQGKNWRILDGNAENIQFDSNSFDLIVSLNVFEHIGDLYKAFSEVKRVLRPFGKSIIGFGPVWTSVLGHHYNHWIESDVELIPPWGHLYMSESEMSDYLTTWGADSAKVHEVIDHVYHSTIINRRSRSDIMALIMSAGMRIVNYSESVMLTRKAVSSKENNLASELTDDILSKISDTQYNCADLPFSWMSFVLEKV